MIQYEIKKVFSKRSSRVALALLLFVMGITCFFAADVSYVDENGDTIKGPKAVAALKAAQKEWKGELDEDTIRRVIAENRRIEETPEAASENLREKEMVYGWKQGFREIRDLLNVSYAKAFREYDYYRADTLTEEEAVHFYENRPRLLKEWLKEEAKDQFSEREKEYLTDKYESLSTPFSYDYMMGWQRLFEYAPTIVMITMLILAYLTAGIFSNEFVWKSDAVFFTSVYGRNKAVAAKLWAGFFIVTAVYFAFLLYTGMVLLYLGADGWNLQVQVDWGAWKCFYHITNWQKYLGIALGGYIGCLFLCFLTMLVSAKTRSAVLAVMVPVVFLFIPSFVGNINAPFARKLIGLLPDQLLQTGETLNYFNLYSLGGRVFGAVLVLMILYGTLTGILLPVIYREYRSC